ncbi:unnamed protein product [Linum tenue]|uniref:Cytochrome P450 n=1 Tax=Linum tenue TaxID=586396 RepID=A0AAV0NYN5_9ROSI|nr:unnamed protein product [Linum tenue]
MVLGDPDLIKEVLSNKARIFSKSDLYFPYLQKIFGQGLAISEGEKWIKVRKIADFALHGDNLKSMVPDMIASAEMMLERWMMKEGKEIEVHEEFRILSSEVISRTAFGSSFKEGQHIFGMLNELMILSDRNTFKMSLPIISCSDLFKTKDEKDAIRLVQRIADSIMEMVKNRQEKVKNREVDGFGKDYLGLLLKAYHDEGHSMKISADQLVDECKTLYVAGQETTNTLLSWMILLLSIHQEWQEEARREVLRVFGPDKTPDSDGITRLKLMGMIINETLRLYSPVFAGFMRVVDKETRLGKFDLPVGVQLHIPIMAIHHDPDIWGEDVHLFKPDRFSEGVAKATNNNPSAFMPFGMGPHTCAGFNFATNEAKITIAMILQRFTFSLSPGYVHSPFPVLAVRPEKGVQVIINAL